MARVVLAMVLLTAMTVSSLPEELDNTLIDVGVADLNLSKFYKALMEKDFKNLPDLYTKLEEDRVKIKSNIQKLQNANIPSAAIALMRLMTIQLDENLYKINGLIPEEAKSEAENGVTSQEPKHKTTNNQKIKKHSTAKPWLK